MNPFVTTALEAAEAAAEVHSRHIGGTGAPDGREKGHQDWVSHVDLEAQEAALRVIRGARPDDAILAEEEGEGHDLREPAASVGAGSRDLPLWIVDPLDGTTNFLHGHPEYCASVGVWVGGRPLAAAVISSRGERYHALRGEGAWKGEVRIRTSSTNGLERSLIGTGFPFKALDRLDEYLEQFRRVLPRTSGIRRQGSAALDLCYLAEGRLDGFWELELAPWDIAAGVLLVEEAGGVVTRLDGSPVGLESGGVLAANGRDMHEALRSIVAE